MKNRPLLDSLEISYVERKVSQKRFNSWGVFVVVHSVCSISCSALLMLRPSQWKLDVSDA